MRHSIKSAGHVTLVIVLAGMYDDDSCCTDHIAPLYLSLESYLQFTGIVLISIGLLYLSLVSYLQLG